MVSHLFDLTGNLCQAGQRSVGDHLEVKPLQILQRFLMGGKADALHQLDIENQDIQLPGRGDSGVQLPQGAGGSVTGICQQRLSPKLPLFIQLFKHFTGHEDLASDNETGRSVLNTQRTPDGEVVLHYEQTAQPIVEYYVQPTPLPGKKKPQSAPLTPKKRRRGRKVFLVCLAVVVLAGAGITALYAAGVLGTAGGGYPGGYERYDSFPETESETRIPTYPNGDGTKLRYE